MKLTQKPLNSNFRLTKQDWSWMKSEDAGFGETDLGNGYVLQVESWWYCCLGLEEDPNAQEASSKVEATRRAPKLFATWDRTMFHRGYNPVMHRHDPNLGELGVSYALYRRVREPTAYGKQEFERINRKCDKVGFANLTLEERRWLERYTKPGNPNN